MTMKSIKYKITDSISDLSYWLHLRWLNICAPFKWMKHCYQRIKYGVSYRDAWNVDLWFAGTVRNILHFLEKNTHSYPNTRIRKYHQKCLKILGETEAPIDWNSEDAIYNTYIADLRKIQQLLSEYDLDNCSLKNEYEFKLEIKHNPDNSITLEGSPEDTEETNRFIEREKEISIYQHDCLHKAIKMLEVYIDDLVD